MRSFVLLLMAIAGFGFIQESSMVSRTKASFGVGERVDYEMYLWGITIGKGAAEVDKKFHTKNNRTCFKVDAYMETLGMATWVSNVNDNWGAYIDSSEIITHESYRKLKEGKYRLNELIKYDHTQDKAFVQIADKATGKFNDPKEYSTPDNVRDVVTGFMYLRVIDFSNYKVKDTLTVSGFFEDKAYSFKILYFGKEVVKTDLGKILCHKLMPIMPSNSLFRGENSVTAWISADANQIPVKVDAKMFVGHAGTEMVSFRGLKNQLKIIQ
ncbi:MAG: DUF3108 domain-containing protein [Cytophagales bacterium]|nr:DUF3108 domain-containing protein [Cytophagales bacterium]MCA6371130.1 DUF3108 domain-containing protein [Cytophagales bacterium]MCA6374745.1 DUF3108 domain-containing protein [Cytophagales bacterium]MCA6384614.1 DUF3108 domain-containing protein [Cytophagales bacterium]